MGEFRKPWTWPFGLAVKVYGQIRRWDLGYNSGTIDKARLAANHRYGMELPDTIVEARMHGIMFTYTEVKWLSDTLNLEDPETTQAVIFRRAVKKFEDQQMSGRAPAGMSLRFDIAFTHDEVKYIRMLLECIGKYRRATPSEKAQRAKDVAKADW